MPVRRRACNFCIQSAGRPFTREEQKKQPEPSSDLRSSKARIHKEAIAVGEDPLVRFCSLVGADGGE